MHHAAERAAVLRFLQRAARHLGDSGSDGVVRAAVDSFLPGGWGDCARYGRRNGSHRALGVSATSCHWFRLDRPVLGTQMQEEANYQISLASLQVRKRKLKKEREKKKDQSVFKIKISQIDKQNDKD